MAGTNSDYLRRLKSDGRQDLIDKIEHGEISVYAAAVFMGYRKKRSSQSRAEQISYHYSRASLTEKRRFIQDNWQSVAAIVSQMNKVIRENKEAKKLSE
ncbi:MAG: hypothetical protein ABJN35_00030 [Erythrobacter sp.]